MKMLWTNRSGLAKAAVILVAVNLVSLGLCGVKNHGFLAGTADFELLGILGFLGSLFGLLVVGVIALWQRRQ